MPLKLTADEVQLIMKASAYMNAAHHEAFNSLASLSHTDQMVDPRPNLVNLDTSCDTMLEIRRAVNEKPYLMDDHLADLEALRELFGKELLQLREIMNRKSLEAVDNGAVSDRDAEVIRHAGLTKQEYAFRFLKEVLEMVDRKRAVLNGENTVPPNGGAVSR